MRYLPESPKLTRRSLLALTAAGGLTRWNILFASGSDFWNKKTPDSWSSEEVEQLISKSPWAKEVTLEFNRPSGEERGGDIGMPPMGGGRDGGMGMPPMGGGRGGGMGMPPMGGGRGGGIGMPPMGGGGRGGGRSGGMESRKVTVRWESAKPIREALKTPLPDSLAGRYVISVDGLPMNGRGRRRQNEEGAETPEPPQDMIERLKEGTFLQPKGRDPVQPGVVERQQSTGGANLLFGFLTEGFVLRPQDKEVTFTMAMGPFKLKTKFKLNEMLYHGEIAV